MICPCKDCQNRKVGCHGSCEAYKEFQRSREAALAAKQKDVDANTYCIESRLRNKKARNRQ